MRIISVDFNRLFCQRLVGHIYFPVFVASIIRFLFTSENFVFPLSVAKKLAQSPNFG